MIHENSETNVVIQTKENGNRLLDSNFEADLDSRSYALSQTIATTLEWQMTVSW